MVATSLTVYRILGLIWRLSFKRLYDKGADLSHLKIMGARACVQIKDVKKLETKSSEGMLCGFSEKEALSYRIWNLKTRKVVESRNVIFIETPPHLIPQPTRQLSPLREFPEVELDNYASRTDLLRDAQGYTAVLDFNIHILAGRAKRQEHGRRSRDGTTSFR